MKGYRFYRDWGSARGKRKHEGPRAVVCRDLESWWSEGDQDVLFEGFSGLYADTDDPPVAYGAISQGYLARCCTRISEAKARELHPALFARLDEPEG